MTTLPTGWRRQHLVDGVRVCHPDGAARGWLQVRERQGPLVPMRVLQARAGAALADGGGEVVAGERERLVTVEGEYATVASVRCGDAERLLGAIWADDFYTSIEAHAAGDEDRASLAGAVRELAQHLRLGLGHPRVRRFLYRPPPGWQAYRRLLTTDWLAPGFPGRVGSLTVTPAYPLVRRRLSALLGELSLGERHGRFAPVAPPTMEPFMTEARLGGTLVRARGHFPGHGEVFVDTVLVADATWSYSVRLESGAAHLDEHRAAFTRLARSIEPLPQPAAGAGPQMAARTLFEWVTP